MRQMGSLIFTSSKLCMLDGDNLHVEIYTEGKETPDTNVVKIRDIDFDRVRFNLENYNYSITQIQKIKFTVKK